jgi:hypothetical protein
MRIKTSLTFHVAAPAEVVSKAIVDVEGSKPPDLGPGSPIRRTALIHRFYVRAQRASFAKYGGKVVEETSPGQLEGTQVTPQFNVLSRFALTRESTGTKVEARDTLTTTQVGGALQLIVDTPLFGLLKRGYRQEVRRRAREIQRQLYY